jgi:hypothetical protein
VRLPERELRKILDGLDPLACERVLSALRLGFHTAVESVEAENWHAAQNRRQPSYRTLAWDFEVSARQFAGSQRKRTEPVPMEVRSAV